MANLTDNITRDHLRLERLRKSHSFFYVWHVCFDWALEQIVLQRGRSLLWSPVIFSFGIGLYFSLPYEPPIVLSIIAIITTLSVMAFTNIRYIWVLLLFLSGFLASQARTHHVHAPMLMEKISAITLEGRVKSIEELEGNSGRRIVLRDVVLDDFNADMTPRYVRLRYRGDEKLNIGAKIKALVSLNPPSAAIYPGGFDFRRYMFFKQIGAVGFIYNIKDVTLSDRNDTIALEGLRQEISERIMNALPDKQSALAQALLVGKRGAITDEDANAIRDAGLAHMLAISGLHIGIFAGTVFFLIRILLSLSEKIALRYSSKKIAAVFAIFAAVFYMLIAGATIPTQRATLMSAIVFIAIIFDRSPISLRLVAVAALVVLTLSPESLLSASFQMSFGAVTALIYFYDRTRHFWIEKYSNLSWYRRIGLYFFGVCLTTIIASIATAPFSLYHFGQVSFLGSVANLVAVPLLAFAIMPFAILSLLCMPLSIEQYPLWFMGMGIEAMLDIAYWAADIPYAVIYGSIWKTHAFVLIVLAALLFILCVGRVRYVSLLVFTAGIYSYQAPKPDILITGSHKLIGFYIDDKLYVSTKRSERFTREGWLRSLGLNESNVEALAFSGLGEGDNDLIQCGENGCRIDYKNTKISYIENAYIQREECLWADLIVSRPPLHDKYSCKAGIIIDKFSSWKDGAHAIYLKSLHSAKDGDDRVLINTQFAYAYNRPWSLSLKK